MFAAAARRGMVKALAGGRAVSSAARAQLQDPSRDAGRLARFIARTRDAPELLVLYSMVTFVLSAAVYTIKRTLLNNFAGSYWKPSIRGDPEKQTERGRVGIEDPVRELWSFWFHVAQIRNTPHGPHIGVPPFHNTQVERAVDPPIEAPGWYWPQAGHPIEENIRHTPYTYMKI